MGRQVLAQGIPAARNACQGSGSSKLNHTAGSINQGPAKETPADSFPSKCYSPTCTCCSYRVLTMLLQPTATALFLLLYCGPEVSRGGGGAIDAANIMKPALSRGELQACSSDACQVFGLVWGSLL